MTSSVSVKQTLTAKLLGTVLPNRMKRLIFISSFIAHIRDNSDSDKELIAKLNKLLQLSNSDSALELPMMLHKKIWDNITIKEIFISKNIPMDSVSEIATIKFVKPQVRVVSEEIIRLIPNWLRYGSNTQIRSDLVTLFTNMDNLLQSQ